MAKSIWQGSIGFGLVDIPVALHAAESSNEFDLTFLDKDGFSPVGYKRFNKATGREVPWERIVRGYEYEKGRYVVLTDADFERASPKLAKEIAIQCFVDRGEIDPMLYDKPYYVVPTRKGHKGYALLVDTLAHTGKVGIASFALRARERLAMIEARDGGLVVHTLKYPEEIRARAEASTAKRNSSAITPKERRMADQIVAGMTEEWDPKSFPHRYHRDLMKLIKKKITSGAIHEVSEPEEIEKRPAGGKVIDLVPLLRQTLQGSRGPRAKRSTSKPRSTSPRARRKSA